MLGHSTVDVRNNDEIGKLTREIPNIGSCTNGTVGALMQGHFMTTLDHQIKKRQTAILTWL